MIGKITSNENMLEIGREKKGEPVIMCEAWKRYYEAARQDGFKSGNEQGIKLTRIVDIIFLIKKNVINTYPHYPHSLLLLNINI